MRRWNAPLLTGLILSIAAFLSYFMVFARWPATRDVPWVNYGLFLVAIGLLFSGVRRSKRKVLPSIALVFGLLVAGAFGAYISNSRNLPRSPRAPAIGATAPDFTLADSEGKPTTLSALLLK